MANECIPLFRPGADITCQTTVAVIGKRFVDISATRDATTGLIKVAPAAASTTIKAFGVAAYDQATVGGRVAAPTTPEDHQALADAAAGGGQPVVVDGRAVAPAADFSSHVGRNSLPATLIVVLVLLAAAALAIVVPTVRRRVLARQAP